MPVRQLNKQGASSQVSPYWAYDDIGLFFLSLPPLVGTLRLGIRLGALPKTVLERPPLTVQVAIVIYLITVLYGILKVRYKRPVWSAFGWSIPGMKYAIAAVGAGVLLGCGAALLAKIVDRPALNLPAVVVGLLFATLGPLLEESLFRGWLLPLLVRSTGRMLGVLLAAVLFAVAHQYSTGVEFFYATVTGAAYGWMRLASGTTTAAAVMHSVYNIVLWALHSA